jgi:hypothetical protein
VKDPTTLSSTLRVTLTPQQTSNMSASEDGIVVEERSVIVGPESEDGMPRTAAPRASV